MDKIDPMKFSIVGLVNEINNRKKEGYDASDAGSAVGSLLVLGLMLFLTFGIWIWGIIVLVKYWKEIPIWAKVLGIVGLLPILPFGPVLTLICVYAGQKYGGGDSAVGSSAPASSTPASAPASSAPASSAPASAPASSASQ